jgi:uncharacterized protein
MKTLVSLLSIAAIVYIAMCAYLYVFQRSFIYFPTPPADVPAAEEVRIVSGGETIRVWRLRGDETRALLYFGGNAEDVAFNIPEFHEFFPQHAVYLVNYRGYGGSSGTPSENALYRDAEAAFDFADERHRSVAVIGRSLGSAVATHVASVRDVEKLALITPADSFTSLASALYPIFPVTMLLRDRYDSLSRAGRIRSPVLFLVAEQDEIIPRQNSRRLAAAIDPDLVTWRVIEGTTHNSIGLSPKFGEALRSFMAAEPEHRT